MSEPGLPANRLLGMIARRHRNPPGGGQGESNADLSFESAEDSAQELPPAEDVTDRLRDLIDRVPSDEIVDPQAFAVARDTLLVSTERTLQKAKAKGARASFSAQETLSLEAVIRVDGSRPSLMLRGAAVQDDHPFLDAWRDHVAGASDAIARAAASIGRIEPAHGSANSYFGTGFVIDNAKALVLTNRHVLKAIRRAAGETDIGYDRYEFRQAAYIDFAAEIGSLAKNRFRLLEAMVVGRADMPRIDAAVLKVGLLSAEEAEQTGQAVGELPPAITLSDAADGPLGQLHSFCTIGFPGRVPPAGHRLDAEDTVDWNWVTYELMGGRHGVKRIAPGLVHRTLGSLVDDPNRLSFGHDATTLGGNSGSPVLAWKDRGEPAFGLHFAGQTIETNYAHALCAIADDVRRTIAAM